MNYWFLFNLTSGAITQAYLGSADQWTNIPSGQGVLGPFPQATASQTVQDAYSHPNYYTVQNGQLVTVANIADLQLADAKNAKLASLQNSCNQALATFTSSALGSVHTYLSGQTDMLLIEAEDRFMQSADYDGVTPVLWYTLENSDVNHTKAQIHQMYLDARNNVQTVKYKMKNLNSQVTAATTVAAVNAIVW